MYLFLVIYSVFNLNVVSWGTREVAQKKTAEQMEAEQKEAEEEAKKKELKAKSTFLGSLFGKSNEGLDLKLKSLFNSSQKGDNEIRTDLKGELNTRNWRNEFLYEMIFPRNNEAGTISSK